MKSIVPNSGTAIIRPKGKYLPRNAPFCDQKPKTKIPPTTNTAIASGKFISVEEPRRKGSSA